MARCNRYSLIVIITAVEVNGTLIRQIRIIVRHRRTKNQIVYIDTSVLISSIVSNIIVAVQRVVKFDWKSLGNTVLNT